MSKLQFISLLSPAVGSFVLVILAWMQSNYRLADLKDSINRSTDKIEARLLRIENDQREFYGITRKLEGRVDELSKK